MIVRLSTPYSVGEGPYFSKAIFLSSILSFWTTHEEQQQQPQQQQQQLQQQSSQQQHKQHKQHKQHQQLVALPHGSFCHSEAFHFLIGSFCLLEGSHFLNGSPAAQKLSCCSKALLLLKSSPAAQKLLSSSAAQKLLASALFLCVDLSAIFSASIPSSFSFPNQHIFPNNKSSSSARWPLHHIYHGQWHCHLAEKLAVPSIIVSMAGTLSTVLCVGGVRYKHGLDLAQSREKAALEQERNQAATPAPAPPPAAAAAEPARAPAPAPAPAARPTPGYATGTLASKYRAVKSEGGGGGERGGGGGRGGREGGRGGGGRGGGRGGGVGGGGGN
ncbi:hypothetical protein ARSEF1564_007597 [Beauveria bassiana]